MNKKQLISTAIIGTVFTAAVHADTMVISKSEAIVNEFQGELKSKLVQAMKSGGPVNAIEVCKSEAPVITQLMSKKYNVELQRVSKKHRNPINKPDAMQTTILDYMESQPANSYYQEFGDNQAIYAKKITTAKVCLACHGDVVDASVASALEKHYPADLATGYKEGELRGIFSVKWSANQHKNIGVKNLRKVDQNLWVGGQPSIAQIAELKEAGITRIINLRSYKEMKFDEAKVADQLGIEYVSLPIAGAKDINFENSRKVRKLLDEANGKVLLHCASSNRVGALLALSANEKGASKSASLAIGKASGLSSLEKVVTTLLK